jgi:TonB-linked SusC/RagA family outer membrane protein
MKYIYCLLIFTCFNSLELLAQQNTINGKVTSPDGTPLQGVSIFTNASNLKAATLTNANGSYSINISPNITELVFSYIGMQTITEKIAGNSVINVQMFLANAQLEGVVVTALGIKREAKALSYSRQSMDVSTLTNAPTTNIVTSLSGRIAGVQITPPSTSTGSARIVIRGNNSITGNNQPLFVVDGIPVDNEPGDGSVTVSGNVNLDYGNAAANINPEDIQSVEVLKGPNAAALYGSRAANGAILITTKKAAGNGKFVVSFNSNSTFQRVTEFPDYQNGFGAGNSFKLDGSGATSNSLRIPDERVWYQSWGAPFLGQPVISINGNIKSYLPQPDNVANFYQTAKLLTNSLVFEGGDSKNNYRVSYTNFTGSSVVRNVNKVIRHNIDYRMINTFTKWLDLDSKITYINEKVTNRQYTNESTNNPVNQYSYMVRDDQISEMQQYKDANGNEINTHRSFENPYWITNENPNQDIKNQLLGTFNVNVKFNKTLRLTGKFGTEMYWWNGYTFNNKGSQVNPIGMMSTFNNTLQNINADVVLFSNNKVGNLTINSFVGVGRFSTSNTKNGQQINSLIQPGLMNLSNSSDYPTVSQFSSKKLINSIYGSTSLGYKNYLFMDITARNDWSSTLPEANNSYFYPSIGMSFVLTDAFKSIPKNILSFAKIRASYAVVGNDTKAYQLIPTYAFSGIYNNQAYASLSTTYFNPNLKPEKTGSQEYGVDLRFIKDRISLNATYYKSATVNQIITAQITPTSGYISRYYNAGEIDNSGIELSLSGIPVQTKNFSWNILVNYAKNHSLVKSLIEGVNSFLLNTWYGNTSVFAEVGQPYGIMRGRGWAHDSLGRKLVLATGLPETVASAYLGNSLPDWTGGISNSFRYKNFSISFLIDIRTGGKFYSGTYKREVLSGAVASTLEGREDYYLHSYIYGEAKANLTGGFIYKDAYFDNGSPDNVYVTPQSSGFSANEEMQMFDASYVKLREVVLSYSLPLSLLKNTFISNAKISFSGRNLWTIYKNCAKGIDPESSVTSGNGQGIEQGSLPPYSTYGFNLNLKF